MNRRRWFVTLAISAVLAAGVGWIGVSGRSYGSDPHIEAMLGDPDAALAFLYPDGLVEPGTSPTAIEYIRDRKWNDDGFDTLAQMLDEAATAYRDPNDPRSELSLLAATDTINLLSDRGDGKISSSAYDSLGHLLAVYVVDIDQYMNGSFLAGDLPRPSIDWNSATVVDQVLADPGALRQVTNAAVQLNGFRFAEDIDGDLSPEDAAAFVRSGNRASTDLLSYIANRAGLRTATKPDARTDAMLEVLRNAVNLRPGPGATLDQFVAGVEAAPHADPTPPLDYAAPSTGNGRWDVVDAIAMSVSYSVGVQLGEAGFLAGTDQNGEPFPWFADEAFSAQTAMQPEHRDAFFASLKEDPDFGSVFAKIRSRMYYGDLGR